ncbi:MAG: glutathione S-transferase family protein [Oceanicola sp.]|nr:glutathione S-transferase family protein [Oceanicola sp.]
MELKVFGSVKSRAMRVIWMLEELEVPFEHVPAAPRSADVMALNATGKVPVLLADGVPITDSTAILTFLADHFGRLTAPAGSLERARQDSMTQFLLDEFDAVLWMASRHSFVLPEHLRLPAIKDSLKWEMERSQNTLLARMGEDAFLMGAQMTVPDIILTHCLSWAIAAKFPVETPALVAYAKRMRARPAFKRAAAR